MALTVGDLVNRVFPTQITQIYPEAEPEGECNPEWLPPPDFPPDLFAVTAYLLETAGAYQHGAPGRAVSGWPTNSFPLGKAEIDPLTEAGRIWREAPAVPQRVRELWHQLGAHRGDAVFVETIGTRDPLPKWWVTALSLMIIADEASLDVGYNPPVGEGHSSQSGQSWVAGAALASYDDAIELLIQTRQDEPDSGGHDRNHVTRVPQLSSICQLADPDVVCVQPKSRTPVVGCTLRTLSHNLAMLPPRGVVRGQWLRPPWSMPNDDEAALNLLLIPYPFAISATAFKPDLQVPPPSPSNPGLRDDCPWGWFDLRQEWLNGKDRTADQADRTSSGDEEEPTPERKRREKALVDFTMALIREASLDVGAIHGVIFPEYSLDWTAYDRIVSEILKSPFSVEMLVAGSSSNCGKFKGNTALATAFGRQGSDPAQNRIAISTSRTKHHRWRLDGPQISTYALASSLDPRALWWERTALQRREIHTIPFRASSTFATMICEDLARLDPCHAVLRSMAPNLVFVLLMDGPQLPERWPARYATTLAEDPGSAVLTFTSLGLMERSNRARRLPENRTVALWKDDTGQTVPISIDRGAHGVILTLSGHRTTEVTFDGRSNPDGRAWRYHGHQPVALRRTAELAETIDRVMEMPGK